MIFYSIKIQEIAEILATMIHVLSGEREGQRQPSKGVLRKICSENMQQMYGRTPMAKCALVRAEHSLLHNFIEFALL